MASDFMRQFMAGWQMGQDRIANQRQAQMMQMRQEQEAYQRQQDLIETKMREEQLKIQKQRIDAEAKAARLEAAQKEHELRSQAQYLQGMPAPTAAEVGVPQQSPEMAGPPPDQINVPQPMMPMPSPTGGEDIQMPVLTGRQQQEMALAEQQRKMREAIGLLTEQEKVKAQFRQPEKTLQQIEAEAAARARGTRAGNPTGSGGGGGLSPTQEAAQIARLTKDWDTVSKNSREMKRQLDIMQTGLSAAKRGDMAAGSQAVLVTFQKILDPTSVVRESEYARSASGLSMLSQIEGKFAALQRGGAGVPVSELEKFASLARQFTEKSMASLQSQKERIGKTADRYKIPRDLIFGDDGAAPSDDGGGWETVGGVRVRKKARP